MTSKGKARVGKQIPVPEVVLPPAERTIFKANLDNLVLMMQPFQLGMRRLPGYFLSLLLYFCPSKFLLLAGATL